MEMKAMRISSKLYEPVPSNYLEAYQLLIEGLADAYIASSVTKVNFIGNHVADHFSAAM
jgi:hypothetical protein